VQHRAAIIEPKAFGDLLGAIDGYDGTPETKAALKLLALTFARVRVTVLEAQPKRHRAAVNNYEFCSQFALKASGNWSVFKVLDYGCGAGEIVGLMRSAGLDAVGCEAFYEGGDY